MLNDDWKNVSISWGTMIPEDIVDAIETFAIEIDDRDLRGLCDKYNQEESDEMKVYILNEEIWDYLNDIAPDGCYFGGNEGDGCDYGFWEYWDEI